MLPELITPNFVQIFFFFQYVLGMKWGDTQSVHGEMNGMVFSIEHKITAMYLQKEQH